MGNETKQGFSSYGHSSNKPAVASVGPENGETIYDVGDVPDYVFVVKQGIVRLEVPLSDGETFFVGPIPETALFGDHEVLTNAQSVARTSAMGAVCALLIPKSNFIQLFNTEIQFVQSLAKQLAMTSRFSCLAMAHLFKHSVENKLASLLLVLRPVGVVG